MQNEITPPEPDHIDRLIASLEAKWDAARGKTGWPSEVQEYAAAAYWSVPKLIAEIRRLRACQR